MADDDAVARMAAELQMMRLALAQEKREREQAEQRAEQEKLEREQAEQRAAQAEQRAAQAEQRAAQAEREREQPEQRAAQVEKRAAEDSERRAEAQSDRGTAQRLADAAQRMAADIFTDVHEFCNLEDQKKHIGPILIRALPLNRAEAPVGGSAILASEMLPYEGSFDAFSSALMTATQGRNQVQHVVAVTQASGSGKTKLAYAQGTHHSLVVFIRVVKQEGTFTPAWKIYKDLVEDWAKVRPRLRPDDQRRVSTSALAALRLLVVSYVQWVAAVLESYRTLCVAHDRNVLPENCRQVALRCLRNGRGDGAVGQIFGAALKQFSEMKTVQSADGGDVAIRTFDTTGVKARAAEVDGQLRSLLWSDADVVVWYDEAQQLMDTPAVFMTQTAYTTEQAGVHPEPTDILYGLTALMSSLTDAHKWKQVVCGPFLELSERLELPDFSCVRGRITSVHHASVITLVEMESSLRRHFELPTPLPPDVTTKLAKLAGRPVWFFDGFWPTLWIKLVPAWRDKRGVSAAELLDLIVKAADDAVTRQTATVARLVKNLWEDKAELKIGRSPHRLCKELYLALKLNHGQVSVFPSAVGTAIRRGLLALQPAAEQRQVNLWDEPMLAAALEECGRTHVLDWTPGRNPSDPAGDPMYSLLRDVLGVDDVVRLGLTTSAKGTAFELLFAWHVLRTVIKGQGSTTLAGILNPLLPPTRSVPQSVSGLRVHTCCALSGEQARTASRRLEFDYLADAANSDKLVINIDNEAGADIAFCAVGQDNRSVLVLVQAKACKETSLEEALRAATPAWQYTTEPQRKALLSGNWSGVSNAPSAKRRAFEALAQEQPHFVASAVRVVLSVNSFQDKSYDMCEELLATDRYARSPVVLCSSTAQAFGDDLHVRLINDCKTGDISKPVSHPQEPSRFVHPYLVEAVTEACAARNALSPEP